MMTFDFDYLDEEFERDEQQEETRRTSLKFKTRKRPDYFKKRAPVRQGMALRNNYRTSRA